MGVLYDQPGVAEVLQGCRCRFGAGRITEVYLRPPPYHTHNRGIRTEIINGVRVVFSLGRYATRGDAQRPVVHEGKCLAKAVIATQANAETRSRFALGQHTLQCLFENFPTELPEEPSCRSGLMPKQFPGLLLAQGLEAAEQKRPLGVW